MEMEEIPLSTDSTDSFVEVGMGDIRNSSSFEVIKPKAGSTSDFEQVDHNDLKGYSFAKFDDTEPVSNSSSVCGRSQASNSSSSFELLKEEREFRNVASLLEEGLANNKPKKSEVDKSVKVKKEIIVPSHETTKSDMFNVSTKPETKRAVKQLLNNAESPKIKIEEPKLVTILKKPENIVVKEETPLITIEPAKPEEKTKQRKRKSKYELLQEKKQKRLIRNRLSAQVHRRKKRVIAAQKERTFNSLLAENLSLKQQLLKFEDLLEANTLLKASLAEKTEENAFLKRELEVLRNEVDTMRAAQLFDDIEFNGDDVLMKEASSTTPVGSNATDDSRPCSPPLSLSSVNTGDILNAGSCGEMSDTSYGENSNARRFKRASRRLRKFAEEKPVSTKLALFAFAFFVSFFNFGKLSNSHSVTEGLLTEENFDVLPYSVGKEVMLIEDDLVPLTMEPVQALKLYTKPAGNKQNHFLNEHRLHAESRKMLDFALSLPSNPLLEEALQNLPEDDVEAKWQNSLLLELGKIRNLLLSKPFVEETPSTVRRVDSESQAVTLYQGDNSNLLMIDAMEATLSTYLHFMRGQPKDEKTLHDERKNSTILCPSAYGVLNNVSIQKNKEKNSEKSQTPHLRRNMEERSDALVVKEFQHEADELNSSFRLEGEPHMLTLVVPAKSIATSDGDSEGSGFLELTCRVESVNELLASPRS